MFTKLLIANRGESAVRIIRACKEMGIRTVAVYSKADAESIHVALADEAICIGEAAAKDSYLNQERIISAAIASKAQAIHPGYGFLAENASFAKLCKKYGIAFVGPSGELIDRMGDKDAARRLMKASGVPIIPGSGILENVDEAKKAAKEIGYPVMLKASAGGGGKGIRVVAREEDLADAFHTASREAESAFGNGDVFLEKYLTHVRHVEMQILADQQGNILCLGERDCSLQLNKQKVLEETPSPVLTEDIRRKMMDAAVLAAAFAAPVAGLCARRRMVGQGQRRHLPPAAAPDGVRTARQRRRVGQPQPALHAGEGPERGDRLAAAPRGGDPLAEGQPSSDAGRVQGVVRL